MAAGCRHRHLRSMFRHVGRIGTIGTLASFDAFSSLTGSSESGNFGSAISREACVLSSIDVLCRVAQMKILPGRLEVSKDSVDFAFSSSVVPRSFYQHRQFNILSTSWKLEVGLHRKSESYGSEKQLRDSRTKSLYGEAIFTNMELISG